MKDRLRGKEEEEELKSPEAKESRGTAQFLSPQILPKKSRFAELQSKLKAKDIEAKRLMENMHKQCKKHVKNLAKDALHVID